MLNFAVTRTLHNWQSKGNGSGKLPGDVHGLDVHHVLRGVEVACSGARAQDKKI
jgi:hypothetical protein